MLYRVFNVNDLHSFPGLVAEVAMPWLLEVEGVLLDSLVNTVLALDGVTGHVVSLGPGFGLLDAGYLRDLCQDFWLRKRARDVSTAAALSCGLCI